MGSLNQSPLQELFPVPIRNKIAVLFGNLFTIKPEIPSQTHFESVGANLDLDTHILCVWKRLRRYGFEGMSI